MTLTDQIKTAQQTLKRLEADQLKLSELEAGKLSELDQLKASSRKDFTALARVQGEVSAYQSLASENDAALHQQRAHLEQLKADQQREAALVEMKATADQTRAVITAERAAHIALVDALESHLAPLVELRAQHRALRATFQQQARAAGVELHDGGGRAGLGLAGEALQQREAQARALLDQLTDQGADVAALQTMVIGHGLSNLFDQPAEPLPWVWSGATLYQPVPFWADLWQRLGLVSGELVEQAERMTSAANDPEAIRERAAQGAGKL